MFAYVARMFATGYEHHNHTHIIRTQKNRVVTMPTYRLNTLAVAVAFAFSAPSIVNAEEAPVQAAKNIEQISVLGSRVLTVPLLSLLLLLI